ncbi:Peptidase family M48 [Pseudomonas linyingensis]|uniref:Peptidase family M48 n=1 Tax=Pseudomonas linyingensis TaxID=915471 RepID=A0A1H7C6R2_9PSED|nr:M48 family metallopeptidase [Pseudomonas linyingensis]SEJ85381.1 Peptidase family M48 [Pseudomonas linyingensis]
MHELAGIWFGGASSRPVAATLVVADGCLRVTAGDVLLAGPLPLGEVVVSSRLGNTPRMLRLADGATFETADNAGVDRLLAGQGRHYGLIHRLESSLRYVLIGLVATIAFAWGGVRYGIPALAEASAFALPEAASRQIGAGVLELLDDEVLFPSELTVEEQTRLRRRFAPLMASSGLAIQLEFRKAARELGANAFALPSGTVIFTDQLVKLAERDEELLGVLAHEIGHIERRHGLRQVLQGSALGLLAMTVTGDVSSVSSLIAGIPLILTQLGYSRSFEHEADRFAADMLASHGIDAAHLGNMLLRLETAMRNCPEAERCADPDSDWTSYLSTHPPTAERLPRLNGR